MTDKPCACTGKGFCPRFQIHQTEYARQVCADQHGPEKGARYRAKWASQLSGQPALKRGPGLVRRLLNVGGAVGRAAVQVAKRLPVMVTQELAAARKAICTANTCGFYRATSDACAHPKCGCPLARRLTLGVISRPSKTELATERCPVGLW